MGKCHRESLWLLKDAKISSDFTGLLAETDSNLILKKRKKKLFFKGKALKKILCVFIHLVALKVAENNEDSIVGVKTVLTPEKLSKTSLARCFEYVPSIFLFLRSEIYSTELTDTVGQSLTQEL